MNSLYSSNHEKKKEKRYLLNSWEKIWVMSGYEPSTATTKDERWCRLLPVHFLRENENYSVVCVTQCNLFVKLKRLFSIGVMFVFLKVISITINTAPERGHVITVSIYVFRALFVENVCNETRETLRQLKTIRNHVFAKQLSHCVATSNRICTYFGKNVSQSI